MITVFLAATGFFGSVEFYVIMACIAAAVVAMACRPRMRGEVVEHLLSSRLSDEYGDMWELEAEPTIEFRCYDDGRVTLTRRGLSGIYMSGAVSLAVTCNGVDIRCEERLVEGHNWDAQATAAVFEMDFLRPGRYNVVYNSDKTGLFVAMSLHVRPGIVATRVLGR